MDENLPKVKEENGIIYILSDGRYLPNVVRPTGYRCAGGYARARADFLLNHRRDIFLRLKHTGRLSQHLEEIEEQAYELRETIMKGMLKKNPLPESLKNTNQLKWVGLMNNYRSSAEEVVRQDVIYPEGASDELEDWMIDNDIPELEVDEVFRKFTPEEELALRVEIENDFPTDIPIDGEEDEEEDWLK